MTYIFKCTKCDKKDERDIPISDYHKEKHNQVCKCGGKMERVIEWEGYAQGFGEGWCGANGSNVIRGEKMKDIKIFIGRMNGKPQMTVEAFAKFARLEHIRMKRARAINARIHKLYEEIKREGKNGTDKTD